MVVEEHAHDLITRWIEPHPWKGGAAEARLTGGKVSVWAIVGHLGGRHRRSRRHRGGRGRL